MANRVLPVPTLRASRFAHTHAIRERSGEGFSQNRSTDRSNSTTEKAANGGRSYRSGPIRRGRRVAGPLARSRSPWTARRGSWRCRRADGGRSRPRSLDGGDAGRQRGRLRSVLGAGEGAGRRFRRRRALSCESRRGGLGFRRTKIGDWGIGDRKSVV